jgi:hypothetical protein
MTAFAAMPFIDIKLSVLTAARSWAKFFAGEINTVHLMSMVTFCGCCP